MSKFEQMLKNGLYTLPKISWMFWKYSQNAYLMIIYERFCLTLID